MMEDDGRVSFFKGFDSLRELGETGFIRRLSDVFSPDPGEGIEGIGDDCAVLPWSDTRSLLVTTDMLVEGRHFLLNRIRPEDLGYKSLAVNLSDISAMGGKPAFSFLSIALPGDLPLDWLEQFFTGKQELAKNHNVMIPGGDTTTSDGVLVINHTVLGFAHPDRICRRSAAVPGDLVCLLGPAGESGAGLKLLKENKSAREKYQKLIDAHHRPQIYVEEAQFLAGYPEVHAMIDLSDGIRSDAHHIAARSDSTLLIDAGSLPFSPILLEACEEYHWPVHELALTAGEDYSLLFTVAGPEADWLQNDFRDRFGNTFAVIGRVTEGAGELEISLGGKPYHTDRSGFDHFRPR